MTTSTVPGRSGGHRFNIRLHRPAAAGMTADGAVAEAVVPVVAPEDVITGLRARGQLLAETGVAALDRASVVASRLGVMVLRYSLALVFIWFGALKLAGASPVYNLIAATLPWFNPAVMVPMLGAVEVVLGLALLVPQARRVVTVCLVGHLCGTFLSFITASS